MKITLIDEHFEEFKSVKSVNEAWTGSAPHDWFDWVSTRITNPEISIPKSYAKLPKSKVHRADIFNIIKDKNNDTFSCCIVILAWGGMNRKYGAALFSSSADWIEVAEKIRGGCLSRFEAYQAFLDLRVKGKLPGMRPAYFTKLIFFLMPYSMHLKSGYIMDQWTAASVNILSTVHVVKVRNGLVTDQNSAFVYESFCEVIDSVATVLCLLPSSVEQMMFSEGRGKGAWRNYVINHRQLNT